MAKHYGASDHQSEGGDEEGTWIYSYADMISLLFCFFVLMYAATADREKVKEISKILSEGLRGAKNVVAEEANEDERAVRAFQILSSMLDLGDSVEEAVGNLERKYASVKSAEAFKEALLGDPKSKAVVDDLLLRGNSEQEGQVTLVLPSDLFFPSGEANLSEKARAVLAPLAEKLQGMSDLLQVDVVGHTDEVPVRAGGRWPSNWELSAARAAAVGAALRDLGVDGSHLQVSGVAHHQPLVDPKELQGDALEAGRRKNRRVEIRIQQRLSDERSSQP
jgi:chemotaxis protein MotB